METLDAYDLAILQHLQQDGRLTNAELAQRVGLSAAPCWRRVRALEDSGVIRGYHAELDPSKLGFAITVFALVSLKSQAEIAFQTLMNTGAGAIRYVMGAIAFVITFGIVYNAARIAYAERSRDLASLRVIGFTKGEVAFVLLGELAIVTLVALPIGSLLGYYLSFGIAAGFSSELYQIPAIFDPASYGFAALVVIGAAVASGWLVKRDIDRAELVSALKTRE